MGDTFNLSGDFRGAMVNLKSTLRDVQQTVGGMHSQDDAAAELKQLIEQLAQALEQAPPHKEEAAQAVAQTAQSLVEQVAAGKPNKSMLQITGEGLKQAAQNLADVMPAVLAIATQIVATVARLKI